MHLDSLLQDELEDELLRETAFSFGRMKEYFSRVPEPE